KEVGFIRKGDFGWASFGTNSLLNSWRSFSRILTLPAAFTAFRRPSLIYLRIVSGWTFRIKAACLTLKKFSIELLSGEVRNTNIESRKNFEYFYLVFVSDFEFRNSNFHLIYLYNHIYDYAIVNVL